MRARTIVGALTLLALGSLAPGARAGDLDERHVVATTAVPGIGLLTGTGMRCTGFVAGSVRIIVTAAHCVLNPAGAPAQESFDFQPAGSKDMLRARVVVAGSWNAKGEPAPLTDAVSDDWAILYTDTPAGVEPLTLADKLPADQLADKMLAAVGYSADIKDGRAPVEDAACRATRIKDFRVDHDCRGTADSAGSPLFVLNPDGTRGPVVGIVAQSGVTSTAEHLVISNLRLTAKPPLPGIDFGGRAVFVGAFVNAARLAARSAAR
jgi:V8-like Glu-specific endopeptidase